MLISSRYGIPVIHGREDVNSKIPPAAALS